MARSLNKLDFYLYRLSEKKFLSKGEVLPEKKLPTRGHGEGGGKRNPFISPTTPLDPKSFPQAKGTAFSYNVVVTFDTFSGFDRVTHI